MRHKRAHEICGRGLWKGGEDISLRRPDLLGQPQKKKNKKVLSFMCPAIGIRRGKGKEIVESNVWGGGGDDSGRISSSGDPEKSWGKGMLGIKTRLLSMR